MRYQPDVRGSSTSLVCDSDYDKNNQLFLIPSYSHFKPQYLKW